MKKAPRETQTLDAGCSKAEPKNFAAPQTPSRGHSWPKFNQLEMVTTFRAYLLTQFGEDRSPQFQVIVVTDLPHTLRRNLLQYTKII